MMLGLKYDPELSKQNGLVLAMCSAHMYIHMYIIHTDIYTYLHI